MSIGIRIRSDGGLWAIKGWCRVWHGWIWAGIGPVDVLEKPNLDRNACYFCPILNSHIEIYAIIEQKNVLFKCHAIAPLSCSQIWLMLHMQCLVITFLKKNMELTSCWKKLPDCWKNFFGKSLLENSLLENNFWKIHYWKISFWKCLLEKWHLENTDYPRYCGSGHIMPNFVCLLSLSTGIQVTGEVVWAERNAYSVIVILK